MSVVKKYLSVSLFSSIGRRRKEEREGGGKQVSRQAEQEREREREKVLERSMRNRRKHIYVNYMISLNTTVSVY